MCNMLNLISNFFPRPVPKNELANVYVFNKIENNEEDIKLLRNTFESLMCVVEEINVQNKTYAELKAYVKEIVKSDFKDFKYIVIIILDNENEHEHIWITEDNKHFHLNGDLLAAIYANKSLEGKFRFFILQTNRVPSENIIYRQKRTLCKPKFYSGKDLRYYATSSGCIIEHEWKEGEPSPFIRLLCNGIDQNVRLPLASQLHIVELLNTISEQQPNECPSISSSLRQPYILGNAR
ncbi:uncharacterized protein LOC129952263 [Eupeodes corollae]|uniref:uncharacterized protein LOC129952263 n=1 Tax=Eupeodes corollae TaxID=290404 RepID=UPI002490A90C|nr:uncharacterized protein LOC129952263 [Eupeodes corollae]